MALRVTDSRGAERTSTWPGRLDTIRYVATDAAGNATPKEAVVTVSGDKRTARR